MSTLYSIGLCGLTARDARLIEIVIARAPNPRFKMRVGDPASLGACDVVIVDAQTPLAATSLALARSQNAQVVVVEIVDASGINDTGFKVQRSSLLLMILRTIERAIEERVVLRAASQGSSINQLRSIGEAADKAGNGVAADSAPTALQPLSALIVDDSLAVRTQLESVLVRIGIHAQSAENAEAALKIVGAHNFDLIFLDVVMPGIDGYELCRRIKQNSYTRKTPILMLTSRSSPFDRARGALAGCDAYLVKPITSASFLAAVDKILTKQAQGNRDALSARGYRTALA